MKKEQEIRYEIFPFLGCRTIDRFLDIHKVAKSRWTYFFIDAEETLSKFMINGMPNKS